jgi:hypothetical protein
VIGFGEHIRVFASLDISRQLELLVPCDLHPALKQSSMWKQMEIFSTAPQVCHSSIYCFLHWIGQRWPQFSGLVGPSVALLIFWFWHWRRNHRTPRFRNSGDTAKANPKLDSRREGRNDRPVRWGTIRVWNPSDDSIVIEPTTKMLHKIFFKRTSNLARYLDTVELAPKENAEFQAEILDEVIPPGSHQLEVEFESENCWRKFTITFEF